MPGKRHPGGPMFDVLTGLENFAELRQNGYYYVDKT